MTHSNTKMMKKAFSLWITSDNRTLSDVYGTYSTEKAQAYMDCLRFKEDILNGRDGKIITFNTFSFTYGFIGEINGKQAFFLITKNYNRYIYMEELQQ